MCGRPVGVVADGAIGGEDDVVARPRRGPDVGRPLGDEARVQSEVVAVGDVDGPSRAGVLVVADDHHGVLATGHVAGGRNGPSAARRCGVPGQPGSSGPCPGPAPTWAKPGGRGKRRRGHGFRPDQFRLGPARRRYRFLCDDRGVVQRAVIRPRRDGDVPVLADVLTEQQPVSRYPFRWPLPFPVESFLVRDHEQAAWVAELDGTVVGHVMVGSVELELSSAVFRGRTGCAEPAVVSVMFVGSAVRGRGVGGLLLDTAVAWARERGRVPVLDVVPLPATALGFYQHRGWVEIGRRWVDWLTADQPHVLSLALPPFEAGR